MEAGGAAARSEVPALRVPPMGVVVPVVVDTTNRIGDDDRPRPSRSGETRRGKSVSELVSRLHTRAEFSV